MNDAKLIQHIAQRGSELYKRIADVDVNPAYIASEIFMVHEHICRLRLEEMLNAKDSDFAHDVGGIHRHLDFLSAKPRLTGGFLPRFAKLERTAP